MTELLCLIMATTFYYLGARALITKWLWSTYPEWLDSFMLCAACSGTWYMLGVSWILDRPFWGYEARSLPASIAAALVGTFAVPLTAALHHKALLALHTGSVPQKDEKDEKDE